MSGATLDLIGAGPLQDLQAAITERLEQFFPPSRFQFAVVPARMTPQQLDRLAAKLPFVGLGWIEWKPDPSAGRRFRGAARFGLYLMASNSKAAGQLVGDKFAPGILGMAQVALAVLHGWAPLDASGTPMNTVEVTECAHLFSDAWTKEDVALVGLTLTVPDLELVDPSQVDGLADFLRMGITWPLDGAPVVENMRGNS